MSDLKKIDQLLNRMKKAAEEIREILPEFEWSYTVNVQEYFSSKPPSDPEKPNKK